MNIAVTPTHTISYPVGGAHQTDALARGAAPGAAPARLFVPAFLPCGECHLCRRGLVGACSAGRRPLEAGAAMAAARELPDRFLVPIDEPADLAPLSDELAGHAGVVAFALHAIAVASLTPGDTAVWLGEGPVARVGVTLATSRGAHAFITAAAAAGAAGLGAELAALAATPAVAHGARKRVLFLTSPDAVSWAIATALADPGTTFVAFGGAGTRVPGDLALPPEARVVLLGAYHPDFLPEAFAALRRAELASALPLSDVRITPAG